MRQDRRGERGFTFIEVLVTATVLAVLATAIVPIYRWDQKRRNERWLKADLEIMRSAIDAYKKLCDENRIRQSDVEQRCYPRDLEELLEGVEVTSTEASEANTVRFLRRIPKDPFTGEAEWGMRSYQDDWDSTSWGGENVYDVYSLYPGTALDGTSYSEW